MTSSESAQRVADSHARDAIASQLDVTMMVEAAAGTGKTTSLVTRALALLRTGRCDVSRIAAITFTVKAAAQLRERMQEALERESRAAKGDERAHLAAAARDLDRAFIGTTHAFCARLLRERPIEAGLDPEFEELDQIAAAVLASDFWQRWYFGHAALGDPRVSAAREAGLEHGLLRNMFIQLVDFHGDVEIDAQQCERPDLQAAVAEVRAFLRTVENDLPDGSAEKQDPFEVMVRRLLRIERTRDLRETLYALELLETGAHASKKATLKNWPDKQRAKDYYLDYAPIGARLKQILVRWREYVHCIAMDVLRPALADFEAERRASARVTFNDLLLGARNLLRDHEPVRHYFQKRFTHLLVDEFQDTDPLQAEMLFFLTGSETGEKNWRRLTPRAGSLFIVGDPKQSIYRFRRADISTYLAVRERIAETGGAIVALSTNFRSAKAICEYVNASFPALFDPASVDEKIQAPHVDLAPHREGGALDGVYLLETPDANNDDLAEAEAQCVAKWIRRAVESGMTVVDGDDAAKARPVRWSDFLLVSRVRTRLGYYVEALESEGIPVAVTGAAAFSESEWLAAAIPLLESVVDPTNAIAVVSFLRGPLCGSGDDDLYEFVRGGGRWSPFHELPEDCPPSIADGFVLLKEALGFARELPPAAAIARTFDRVGLTARASAAEQAGTSAGNVLLALAIAREESARGASYAAVVERLAGIVETSPEIEELDVDPSRTNAVRLMNLHQVKGLEAPVVFLIEPSTVRPFPPERHIDRSGDVSRGFFPIRRKNPQTFEIKDIALPAGWDTHAQREQRFADAEERRLLYVAATRARNVLVVGAARKGAELAGRWKDLAQRVTRALFAHKGEDAARDVVSTSAEIPSRDAIAERYRTAGRQSYSVVPVTRVAHGSHETLVRAEEGLGRGTSWGRVLHRLFEAMLREPALDVRAYAESLLRDEERDAAEVDEVMRTVDALRSSPLWGRVVASDEKYAEVPFALNVDARSLGLEFEGETLLHGTIDLVFREGARWHIVDYKSDSTAGRLEPLVAYYKPQVEHYARFWRELTGAETVAGLFFVDGCVERWV